MKGTIFSNLGILFKKYFRCIFTTIPKLKKMRKGNSKVKLLLGAAIIIFGLFQYYSNSDVNEFTGKKQHISISTEQEVAIGLQSAPQMAQQHGGLYPDQKYQEFVDLVGQKLVNNSIAKETNYKYDFHLLKDPETINAFALPGGQVFITYALFSKLENEDQLAGVLGHEIGHVVGRHSAERMSKQNLTQGILSGVAVGMFVYGTAEPLYHYDYWVKQRFNGKSFFILVLIC